VERRGRHRGTRDPDRFHHAERCDPARSADLGPNVEQPGVDLLGRILVGGRPAGGPGGRTHRVLQRPVVHLHDDPVDLVLDGVPPLTELGDHLLDVGDRARPPRVRGHRHSPAREQLVELPLRGRHRSAGPVERPDPVRHHGQWAGRRHPWVLLPQRAGGRVPRIGERRPPGLDQGRVQAGEVANREVHLPPHLHRLREVLPPQRLRDRADRADVDRDVLPNAAIAARRRTD